MNYLSFLLLDTQTLFQEALADLILSNFTNSKVFKANSVIRSDQIIELESIDMIILDTQIEGTCGMEYVRRLRKLGYAGKILFLSSTNSRIYSYIARFSGANGLICKNRDICAIKGAIKSLIHSIETFEYLDEQTAAKLSAREAQVLTFLVMGCSNKQISGLLELSDKTVSTYKSRILKKFNADSIIEVINLRAY